MEKIIKFLRSEDPEMKWLGYRMAIEYLPKGKCNDRWFLEVHYVSSNDIKWLSHCAIEALIKNSKHYEPDIGKSENNGE